MDNNAFLTVSSHDVQVIPPISNVTASDIDTAPSMIHPKERGFSIVVSNLVELNMVKQYRI